MEDKLNIRAIYIPISLHDSPRIVNIGDHSSFSNAIGCRCIDVVSLWESDTVSIDCFVDDEGMINGSEINGYWLRAFAMHKTTQPLYGATLVSMTDLNTGDSIDIDPVAVCKVLREHFGFTERDLSAIEHL